MPKKNNLQSRAAQLRALKMDKDKKAHPTACGVPYPYVHIVDNDTEEVIAVLNLRKAVTPPSKRKCNGHR